MSLSNRSVVAMVLTGVLVAGLLGSADGFAAQAGIPVGADWSDYLGGPESSQFSPLDQVNRSNVGSLVPVWSYRFPGNGESVGNPLVIGGRMYAPYSGGVVALDAAAGRELWRHEAPGLFTRGLATWISPDGTSRRLFFSVKNRLYAIDAATGASISDFGESGSVDLKHGLDRDPATIRSVESQAPGRVFENFIILGTVGSDAPGYIRAYDVRSGRLVWTFHGIPHPGEPGYEDWPKGAWKTAGGANNWSGMTVDPASGTLFIPFASAKDPDNYYGVKRTGNNTYADCLVALDARTGRHLWHFQTVHHNLWDYDLPQAPQLLTLTREGKRVDAVVAASKTGFIFAFDRRTGRPLFPIEERPVPQSDVAGERTSPTQPFPLAPAPFARQHFSADDLSPDLSTDERQKIAAILAGLRNEGLFTPPSLKGTVEMPGAWGGTNLANGAVDPSSGRFFVVSADIPGFMRLERPDERTGTIFLDAAAGPGAVVYARDCAKCHGAKREGSPPAIPALAGLPERRSVTEARDIIVQGRGLMPAANVRGNALTDLLSFLGFPAASAKTASQSVAEGPPPHDEHTAEYSSGTNFIFSSKGIPASRPPWSTLTAYDMNAGTLLWQVPYGELPGMKGAGQIFPRGALIATAGGVLIAGSQDRVLRAWDMDNGKVLLEAPLPSTPGGVPAAYLSGGREFIAVPAAQYEPHSINAAAGGSGMPAGRNSIVVFALPLAPDRGVPQ